MVSAACGPLVLLAVRRFTVSGQEADLRPALPAVPPRPATDIGPDEGPVMVTVEHLRRLERFTAADVQLRERRLAFHLGEQPPRRQALCRRGAGGRARLGLATLVSTFGSFTADSGVFLRRQNHVQPCDGRIQRHRALAALL